MTITTNLNNIRRDLIAALNASAPTPAAQATAQAFLQRAIPHRQEPETIPPITSERVIQKKPSSTD